MHAIRKSSWLGIFCVLTVMIDDNSGTPVCKYGGKMNSAGKCVCPTFSNCTKNDEVCGSNSIPYTNECELKKDSCQQQKYFFVFKKGMCGQYGMSCSFFDCQLNCPYGLVQDGYGCILRCECRAIPCGSMSSCHLSCDDKNGVVVDDQGCPKCQCKKRCRESGFI